MPALPSQRPVAARVWTGVVLGAIVVLTVWLRLRHAATSMAFDEMASMYFAGQPWRHLWGWWMVRETNPPLFYALLKLWCMVVPVDHWSIRALPLIIGFAHCALFGHFVRVRFGWPAALLGLLLFALSASDIYQSGYVRGYGLAKLLVLGSFIGLIHALQNGGVAARRGWAVYVTGAALAVYCHTTMLLWPVIATAAVMADAALHRAVRWRQIMALMVADGAVMALSGWVLVMAVAQLKSRGANISWLEPLGWGDTWTTVDLQLLTGGTAGSLLMGGLMVIGVWRCLAKAEIRLALLIVIFTLLLFKATDRIHPIISDFTLHWCFSFTALIAAVALPAGYPDETVSRRRLRRATTAAVLALVTGVGLKQLLRDQHMMVPQDWRATLHTVAAHPGSALLADHEAIGVVIEQACRIEFGTTQCPFPLVVMADPRMTDSWAIGGMHGPLTAPPAVRQALGPARSVYVFSRYYYTPLEHLGLKPRGFAHVYWDDGELIGPLPVGAFDPPHPGDPPRVPDPDAQFTGAPDEDPDQG